MTISKSHELYAKGDEKVADAKEKQGDAESHNVAELAAQDIPKGVPDAGRHQAETAIRHRK